MLGLVREKYSILKKVVKAFSIICHHTMIEFFFLTFLNHFVKKELVYIDHLVYFK